MITFNFDAVPEILQTSEGRLSVVDPTNVKASIKAAHDQDKAPVLKLHGSLTWSTIVGGDGFEMTNQPETALEYLGTREVVIGLPGPKKRGLYAKTLNELRGAAEQALLVAGQVIFVGYRFPPTDADARRFLLEAIRKQPHRRRSYHDGLGRTRPRHGVPGCQATPPLAGHRARRAIRCGRAPTLRRGFPLSS